jgi:NAD(P)-dependent dehydrogenase (short-subunit alcohol dehydrogenase family)
MLIRATLPPFLAWTSPMHKTCLITGASGGVGRALALRLAADGWQLALVSRDAAKLDGLPGAHIAADVSTADGAAAALAAATAALGGAPAGLAHCAGNTLIAPIARTREAQYREVMAANLDSAFFTLQAWLGALASARQPGAAVLFSSVVAGIGVANHPAIAAAKGGIEALVRSLAADVSASGVRINAVAPGLMRSPMTERMVSNEAAAKQIAAQYPLGRHGDAASDGAAAAAWLLSEESSWITGQVLGLDGGFSAVRPYVKAG